MHLTVTDLTVNHNTFVIQRSYPAPPERVFAALTDPAKKRVWFAEGASHDVEVFEMDFQVGGKERAVYRFNALTPFPGVLFTYSGMYLDIVPDKRVVISSTMAIGENRISAALATFEVLTADEGTNLVFTHQCAFFEGADGPEMRQGGWQTLLDKLGQSLAG